MKVSRRHPRIVVYTGTTSSASQYPNQRRGVPASRLSKQADVGPVAFIFSELVTEGRSSYGLPMSRVLLEPEICVADADGKGLESAAELCWYYGHGNLTIRNVFSSIILCRPLESVYVLWLLI
jgi:hypothetical protein